MNVKCPICHKEQQIDTINYCCIKIVLNYNPNAIIGSNIKDCIKISYIVINNIQINFFYFYTNTIDISFLGKEIYTSIHESKDEIRSKINIINKTLVLDELIIYLNKVINNLIFI